MKVGIRRLRKLANHLIDGELGHEKFDVTIWNSELKGKKQNACGTSGCAVGECPVLFENDWKFDSDGMPVLRGTKSEGMGTLNDARIFFGLTSSESLALFIHGHELHVGTTTLPKMSRRIKADSMGRRILKFCDLIEKFGHSMHRKSLIRI